MYGLHQNISHVIYWNSLYKWEYLQNSRYTLKDTCSWFLRPLLWGSAYCMPNGCNNEISSCYIRFGTMWIKFDCDRDMLINVDPYVHQNYSAMACPLYPITVKGKILRRVYRILVTNAHKGANIVQSLSTHKWMY